MTTKKQTRKAGIHLQKTIAPNIRTGRHEWYWDLVASNGRIIARSSETYTRKGNAIKSILVAAGIFLGGKPYELIPYYDHSKPGSPFKHC